MLQFLYMYSKTLKKFDSFKARTAVSLVRLEYIFKGATPGANIGTKTKKEPFTVAFIHIHYNRRLVFCCGSSTILSSKATFLTDLKSS